VTPEGLQVLAQRADTVVGRPDTRLDGVHARIAHARQRRQAGIVGAAVVAVVLALTAGLALLALTGPDEPTPIKPAPLPTSTPSVLVEDQPAVRRLTYADEHWIHWGDRAIDVGRRVEAVHPTDDGVVFVRGGKSCTYDVSCRTLWFTDGSEPVRLGVATGSAIRGYGVRVAEVGSTVVWSEADPEDRTPYYPPTDHYVAYDTSQRREVGRFGSRRSMVVAVGEDSVYWLPDARQCVDFYGECLRSKVPLMRLDTATGRQVPVSWSSYWTVRRAWPRTLMSPQLEEIDDQGAVVRPPHAAPRLSDTFAFRIGDNGTSLIADDGSVDVILRLAQTGEPVRLRVPGGYTDESYFRITQWLDDDRVVIEGDAELLVCRLSSGRCRTAVRGGSYTTDFGGHG
jgi:hypothetical protein